MHICGLGLEPYVVAEKDAFFNAMCDVKSPVELHLRCLDVHGILTSHRLAMLIQR